MPRITVNGASIAYDLFGSGPLLVWNSGGRQGRSEFNYLIAGRLSTHYSVLIWDRRNSAGVSDVAISDAPSYAHADSDDLHEILQELGLGPACLAGGSAGCALSLTMAHRYPKDVKSLLLLSPATDNASEIERIANARWADLAEAAEQSGMQEALDVSTNAWVRQMTGHPQPSDNARAWLGQTVGQRSTNRELVDAMDPLLFAGMARRWADTMTSSTWLGGLTEEEVGDITLPALVVPGDDRVHPRQSGERLAEMLSEATWVEYPDPVTASSPGAERVHALFPEVEAFLAVNS